MTISSPVQSVPQVPAASNVETPERRGRIITFYSYKGGTGRSMALANMAWLLAMKGKQVLVIDWDLEAPGLHRYFHPFLADKDLRQSDGVIDFLVSFADGATKLAEEAKVNPKWYLPYSRILRNVRPLDYEFPDNATLDFIPAGRQSGSYATRVNMFNFQDFYDKLGGWALVEEVKRQIVADYDYILIDSRTGVSDTAGICTDQFPDDLVIAFTLNTQSIEGAAAVAAWVTERRRNREPLRIFPVPMRVENAESERRDNRQLYAKAKFQPFLEHLTDEIRARYWDEATVTYNPFFAYEELLAYFKERVRNPSSILSAIARLTQFITGLDVTSIPEVSDDEQRRMQTLFARVGPVVEDRIAPVESGDVYWSANDLDRDEADGTKVLLQREGISARIVKAETGSPADIRAHLGRCGTFVLLYGRRGLSSRQYTELAIATEAGTNQEKIRIIPVALHGSRMRPQPGFITRWGYVDWMKSGISLNSATELAGIIQGKTNAPGVAPEPFPWLRPYTESDAGIFYGRELAAAELADLVAKSRIVEVRGGVGQGKTSLVHAGLLPILRRKSSPSGLKDYAIVPCRALNQPIANLLAALYAAGGQPTPLTPNRLDALIQVDLTKALNDLLAETGARQVLVVMDEFDGNAVNDLTRLLFEPSEEQRKGGRSHSAVYLDDVAISFVLLVDDDDMLQRGSRSPNDSRIAVWTVPPWTVDDRRRTVSATMALAGVELESDLAERISTDSDNASAAVFGMCLSQLWQSRHGIRITHTEWEALLPLAGVIGRWADSILQTASAEREKPLDRFLGRLIQVTESGPICRAVAIADLSPEEAEIAQSLLAHRLVRDDTEGELRLIHPIVLRESAYIRGRFSDNRTFLLWYQTVQAAAQSWQESRSDGDLLRGTVLAQSATMLQNYGDRISDIERALIQASMEAGRVRESGRTAQRRKRVWSAVIGAAILAGVVAFGTALLRNSHHTPGQTEVLLDRGLSQSRSTQWQAAAATFTELVHATPGDYRGWLLRGNAERALGLYDDGLNDYQKALALNPDSSSLHWNLGVLWQLRKDPRKAIEQYNLAISLDPSLETSVLRDRAWAFRQSGQFDAALNDYKYLLLPEKKDPQTMRDQAYTYELRAAADLQSAKSVHAQILDQSNGSK